MYEPRGVLRGVHPVANGRATPLDPAHLPAALDQLVGERVEGLGEVALVPNSSPISQSGLLFYNTLFDENAASHIALGQAYSKCIRGGLSMSEDALVERGCNRSLIHIDWMIGSAEIDVDGVAADGAAEPLMRRGEWAS